MFKHFEMSPNYGGIKSNNLIKQNISTFFLRVFCWDFLILNVQIERIKSLAILLTMNRNMHDKQFNCVFIYYIINHPRRVV